MESTPWWVATIATVLTIAGTLGGVVLTQRHARRREDMRWQRERQRDEQVAEHGRDEERTRWVRERRLASYTDLLRAFDQVAYAVVLSKQVTDDCWEEGTEVYKARWELRRILPEADLFADEPLQLVIARGGGLAEDLGHAPYDDETERRQFQRRLALSAWRLRREAEDAVREELKLPKRREPTQGDDKWWDDDGV